MERSKNPETPLFELTQHEGYRNALAHYERIAAAHKDNVGKYAAEAQRLESEADRARSRYLSARAVADVEDAHPSSRLEAARTEKLAEEAMRAAEDAKQRIAAAREQHEGLEIALKEAEERLAQEKEAAFKVTVAQYAAEHRSAVSQILEALDALVEASVREREIAHQTEKICGESAPIGQAWQGIYSHHRYIVKRDPTWLKQLRETWEHPPQKDAQFYTSVWAHWLIDLFRAGYDVAKRLRPAARRAS